MWLYYIILKRLQKTFNDDKTQKQRKQRRKQRFRQKFKNLKWGGFQPDEDIIDDIYNEQKPFEPDEQEYVEPEPEELEPEEPEPEEAESEEPESDEPESDEPEPDKEK